MINYFENIDFVDAELITYDHKIGINYSFIQQKINLEIFCNREYLLFICYTMLYNV